MDFSPAALKVLKAYDARDARETALFEARERGEIDQLDRDQLLLAVGREAAEFLAALVVAHNSQRVLEVGTSFGYSTLFFAKAVSKTGGKVITLEFEAHKQAYAKEQLKAAGLDQYVEWHLTDAVQWTADTSGTFDFVFMDLWKEFYGPCLKNLHPKLEENGLMAADNMIYPPVHRPAVREYRKLLQSYGDIQTALLPIGSGIELSSKLSVGNENL